MSDIQYNLQLEKICTILKLGKIVCEPEAIAGGLLHKMYAVETNQGKYAVKALNPQIMLRPVAMQHFIQSELIVNIASKHIPAIPAKKFDGTSIQEIENQFYLVFDWADGKNLKQNEIEIEHCKVMGSLLADIHMTDFSELGINNDKTDNGKLIDWNYYLHKGHENNAVWVNCLSESIDMLYEWTAEANKSAKLLAKQMVISHRDLDSKNVMWNQGKPLIIDWESAGYVNPRHELIETAIYWSENDVGNIDKDKFFAFISEYKNKYGELEADWKIVLSNGYMGKLGWLEYNLKRSLFIECTDEMEQQMGTRQVTGTMNAIKRYADMNSELERWLNNEISLNL